MVERQTGHSYSRDEVGERVMGKMSEGERDSSPLLHSREEGIWELVRDGSVKSDDSDEEGGKGRGRGRVGISMKVKSSSLELATIRPERFSGLGTGGPSS